MRQLRSSGRTSRCRQLRKSSRKCCWPKLRRSGRMQPTAQAVGALRNPDALAPEGRKNRYRPASRVTSPGRRQRLCLRAGRSSSRLPRAGHLRGDRDRGSFRTPRSLHCSHPENKVHIPPARLRIAPVAQTLGRSSDARRTAHIIHSADPAQDKAHHCRSFQMPRRTLPIRLECPSRDCPENSPTTAKPPRARVDESPPLAPEPPLPASAIPVVTAPHPAD